ncbi:MAG TPA: LysM peptidoglycan-binding domain-containing protein [Luteimonas sp.]|jgi:nucleoid-associated protein YgaU|nr:LysM peptidoglycan-binding domain-containing protein [Luteimonas sp.]
MANKPGDDRLSLRPSRSAPDFSNVRSGDARPDFSNVQGSADTTPADRQARTYTVQSGDTLSEIAQRELGRASAWHAIFEANRDQIDDPDLIRPGQVLRLPD